MNRLLLVNYHYIRDPDAIAHPGIHPISLRDFTDQVDLLLRKLHPASPEEVADFAKGRDRLPGPSFFLTLDDGLMDHLEAAREVLRPRGLRVAFFVCSRPLTERLAISVHKVHWLRAMTPPVDFRDEFLSQLPTEWRAAEGDAELAQAAADTNQYDPPEIARLKYLINFHLPYDVVDRVTSAMLAGRGVSEAGFCGDFYMDGGDLGELAGDGHVIGAHSHQHRPLSRLTTAELDDDLRRNIAALSPVAGPVTWLSYPWGSPWSIPDDAEAVCERHGFELAITLRRAWNGGGESAARLNRINTNELAGMLAATS